MRRNTRVYAVLLTSSIAVGACVGGSKDQPQKKDDSLKAFILDKPPASVGAKLDINFDNKAVLLGAKVTPQGPVRPGGRVKVTMYWKCNKPLNDKSWKLFTHVLDASGERILNIDNVGPLRRIQGKTQALAPSKWEPGKVYVDEQSFTMPRKIKTDTAQVVVGIWHGNDRIPIVSGPHDRKNRGIVTTLSTAQGKGRAHADVNKRIPTLRVDRLDPKDKIQIDGKLEEPAWKTAPSTGAFVDVRTGRPNTTFPVNGSAKMLWDDKGFYVAFTVKDPDITGGFKPTDKDPQLWTKDTVEIMVDPDGDGDNRDYYEIQISPQNLVFDSQFDTYNQPKKGPQGPFGHQDWSAKLKSAVVISGTIDKKEDKDDGYVIEAMIPWKSFGKAKKAPPEVGDTWRINLYAMQQNGGVAWSPILGQGNFHRASRFGKVLWAEKGWMPTPVAAPGAPAGSVMPAAMGSSAPPVPSAIPAPVAPSARPAAAPSVKKAPPALKAP